MEADFVATELSIKFLTVDKICRHKDVDWKRIDAFTEEGFCNKCKPKRMYRKNDFEGLSIWFLGYQFDDGRGELIKTKGEQ